MAAVPLPSGSWPSPLTPELAASGAVALSYAGAANGSLVWVEGRPAEKGRSVLMRVDLLGDAGATEVFGSDIHARSRVHEYGGTPWAVVGSRMVVSHFEDQRLRLLEADGNVRILTPVGCRYADGAAHPDGQHLVCVREDHRRPGEAVNAVVRIDLDRPHDDGTVLGTTSDFVASPRVNPDGRTLAWIAWNHPSMPWDDTELRVGRLTDAGLVDEQVIAGGPGESVIEPSWAADGSLCFLSDRTGWWNLYRWHDGRIDALTNLEAEVGGPLWNLGMRSYAHSPDGRILLRINRGTVETLAVLDLHARKLTELSLPFVAFGSIGVLDARTGFAIASSRDAMPALIAVDLVTGEHQVIRSAGPSPLSPQAISIGESIRFETAPAADGSARNAQAWFYPPHHPGHRLLDGETPALIVTLHGGPTSHAGPSLKIDIQFWTSRGFAVVDVNYGGSTGFGRPYRERLRGQWGPMDLHDAVAAVDHLSSTGRVDGKRVAIRGRSAGGFSVLSALAFTQRFAAGINYFGVADLEALAAHTHKFEARYLDSLVAPLPEGLSIYRERSPVHHMDRCRGALLTLQGTDDQAVPVGQSRAIVDAARRAGCPVAYLEFDGEGHGFRQAANIVRGLEAELVFLGRVFRFQPDGNSPPLSIDNADRLPA